MKSRHAFTLLETIIALGIFAGAGLAMLALMSAAATQIAAANEALVAHGLRDAVKVALVELQRDSGIDTVAAWADTWDAPRDRGLFFTADRRGVALRQHASGTLDQDEFFAVEVRRFPVGPLRYDATEAHVAFDVLVSWPYRANATQPTVTPAELRREFSFSVVLIR